MGGKEIRDHIPTINLYEVLIQAFHDPQTETVTTAKPLFPQIKMTA